MPTRSRRSRTRRRSSSRAFGSAGQRRAVALAFRGTGRWLGHTLAKDKARLAGIPLVLLNWLLLAAVIFVWCKGYGHPGVPLLATAAFLIFTGVRAATALRGHQRALRALYDKTLPVTGLPRGTTTAPPNPAQAIKVRRWWRNRPADFTITIASTAPAATPMKRPALERTLVDLPNRWAASGGGWVFTWPTNTTCRAVMVRSNDVRLVQKTRLAEQYAALSDLFGSLRGQAAAEHGHDCQVTEWEDWEGKPVLPATVEFTYGTQDVSDPAFKDRVEREYDRRRRIAGHEWLYDWSVPGVLSIHLVPETDVEAKRKRTARWASDQVTQSAGTGKDPVISTITRWADDPALGTDEDWRQHGAPDPTVPVQIRVDVGSRDLAGDKSRTVNHGFMDAASRVFPGMVYGATHTTEGVSTLVDFAGFPTGHPRAERTRISRWLDDTGTMMAGQGKGQVQVDVLRWADDPATQNDAAWAAAAANPSLPTLIEMNVGTRDVSGRKGTDMVDRSVEALRQRFPGLVFVPQMSFGGGATVITYEGFPASHPQALRYVKERSLRMAVDTYFIKAKTPVTTTISEWFIPDDENPRREEYPKEVTVELGTVNISKPADREAFEDYLHSITATNDWNYTWGNMQVMLQAAQKLPTLLPFPERGTQDFEKFVTLAAEGKIWFGKERGGGDLMWNMNDLPHGLIGGDTGSGKGGAQTVALFGMLWNPQAVNVLVGDPKRTDWSWTAAFPNVIGFGASDAEICAMISQARTIMERHQDLLAKRGVEKMSEMRKLYAEHPDWEAEDGGNPRRLILAVDELIAFLGKKKSSNEEIRDLVIEADQNLDQVALLGRAMETNIMGATQKPAGDFMSTQLREQMKFRLGLGAMDQWTSQQILTTNHGTKILKSTVGRGHGGSKGGFYPLVQVFYLPPLVARQWLAERMVELGYQQVQVENASGSRDARWVSTARVDA